MLLLRQTDDVVMNSLFASIVRHRSDDESLVTRWLLDILRIFPSPACHLLKVLVLYSFIECLRCAFDLILVDLASKIFDVNVSERGSQESRFDGIRKAKTKGCHVCYEKCGCKDEAKLELLYQKI